MSLLSQRSQKIFIPGNCGHLESLYSSPLAGSSEIVAVVCHPHPLHGGSMHNKVVTTIAKTFDSINAHTIRFNFRGVGDSIGEFDAGCGETEDLLSIIKWLKIKHPKAKIVTAGFSFGSYICCKAATKINPSMLITIAPAIIRQNYENIPSFQGPWLLVQGTADELTDTNAVLAWAKKQIAPPKVITITNASHFFHGKLQLLQQQLVANIKL